MDTYAHYESADYASVLKMSSDRAYESLNW